MGKDLHYSIRPFIERALTNHQAVKAIEQIELDEYFGYRVKRNFGYRDVIVILSDAYNFNYYNYVNKPNILKDGGFLLVARPEATCFEMNDEPNKMSVGRLARLLGALNKDDFWNYDPPKKEEKK